MPAHHDGSPSSTSPLGTGCESIAESLPAYIYGDLPPEERSGIETHIETCGACKAALGEFRAVRDALDAAPVPEMPLQGDLAAQVMARAQAESADVTPVPRRAASGTAFSYARAAVVLLALALGISYLWMARTPGGGEAVALADIEGMVESSADTPDVVRVIDKVSGKLYGVNPLEDTVAPPIHAEGAFVYSDKQYRVLRDRASRESTLLAGYMQLRLADYLLLEKKDAELARAEYQKVFDYVTEGKVHALALARLDDMPEPVPGE